MCAVNCSLCELLFRGITYGTIKLVKMLCWMRNIPSCIVFWLRGNWTIDKKYKKGIISVLGMKDLNFPEKLNTNYSDWTIAALNIALFNAFQDQVAGWADFHPVSFRATLLLFVQRGSPANRDSCFRWLSQFSNIYGNKNQVSYIFASQLWWGLQRLRAKFEFWGYFDCTWSRSTLILDIREQWWSRGSKHQNHWFELFCAALTFIILVLIRKVFLLLIPWLGVIPAGWAWCAWFKRHHN